ncbi:peptide methionine sulfoxide reductase [Mycena galericulata]|nr:peptide methionine sulfoxide reductase [Mycena galericulata]
MSTISTPAIAIFPSGLLGHGAHLREALSACEGWYTGVDYRTVCSGATQHAEAARIEFDPALVEISGRVQYRSASFTTTPEQAATARRITEEVQAKHFRPKGTKIVSEIREAGPWWDAEDYHQLHLFNNPDGYQCPTHRLHW